MTAAEKRGLAVVTLLAANGAEAEALAKSALEQRLAACANIGGAVKSLYHWDGALEQGEEIPVSFKTRRELVPALMTFLEQAHSYDVPYIAAESDIVTTPAYLNWVYTETKTP